MGRRAGRKTIVFTAARATAQALAAALDWRHLAVVAGRTAQIASGRLPVGQVFAWFAPVAQHREAPHPLLRLDTLIATDVASEGLNLQDADGVIHYDLPWTPLALEQRVGRARRLGSCHRAVRVWWFAPPPALERHLGLAQRIGRKAALQLALATPRTAVVGRAALTGGVLDQRESLLDGPIGLVQGHASAGATGESLAVVRLRGRSGDAFRLLAEHSTALPLAAVARALASADVQTPASCPSASWIVPQVRALATIADRTPPHPVTRSLARAIGTRARDAARRRSPRLLQALDRALQLVLGGLPVGAERELADWFIQSGIGGLASWADRWGGRSPALGSPEVIAVLFGAPQLGTLGTPPLRPEESSGYIRVNDGLGRSRSAG
jgi:hypothetical protein